MKIAIVGTTANLSENEERNMMKYISLILKRYPLDTVIISGGAKGVDTIALEIAKELGFKTKVYAPEIDDWEPPNGKIGYKKRNLEIANNCDELYCFSIPVRKTKCYHHETPQNHVKTAGCWTANKVMQMGKPCQLVVISSYFNY